MKAYEVKITINDSKPAIWRRAVIPAGLTFSQCSLVMNTIIDWCGYHNDAYFFEDARVRLYDDIEDLPPMDVVLLEKKNHLIDEFFDTEDRFTYVYDFGDYWDHTVQIEKIIDDYENNYPILIDYRGDTPWEDCGGIGGYYDMLDILSDPQNPEFKEIKKWVEEHWNSGYDKDEVSQSLEAMKLVDRRDDVKTTGEIYEDYFLGKTEFGRAIGYVAPPKEKVLSQDAFLQEEQSVDMEQFEEMSGMMMSLGFMRAVYMLRKNTDLTDKEIQFVLEITDEEMEDYPEFEEMLRELDMI